MKRAMKAIGLMLLILGVYILVTTAVSSVFCLIFGLPFDFFVSLALWFFLPSAAVCVLFGLEGG